MRAAVPPTPTWSNTRWLETRLPEELAMWSAVYEMTTQVMSQAFSRQVITLASPPLQEVEDFVHNGSMKWASVCFHPTVNFAAGR